MEALNATLAAAAPACAASGVQALVYSALLAALVQTTAAPDEAERRSYPADAGAAPAGLRDEYDWVVVGGGTAGSALAARLADRNPAWAVLVVEAGGDPEPAADLPRLFPRLRDTQMARLLRTDPEPGACGAYGSGGCPLWLPRVLGGGSALGPGLYHRASPADFDRWAEPEGCAHWGAEHMLRAFKDVEDYQPADAAGQHHGVGGELAVEPFAEEEPLLGALLAAVGELNQSLVEDPSAWSGEGGGAALGFGLLPGTVRNGTRCNAARAFLRRPRPNLHLLKHATVTKVLIDPDTMTALGVQYERGGEVGVVRASREVVLSAGAVGSAQLLMLSGVGPADHLREVGVPLLQDLPVGYNLQDHVTYGGLLLVEEFVGQKESSDAFLHMAEAYEYLLFRAGPLSSPGYHSLAGFLQSGEGGGAPGDPDLGIFFFGLESRHREWLLERQRALGWSEEALAGLAELLDRGDAIAVAPAPLRPHSRGRVLLRGADHRTPPLVQPGYLQDPRDVDTMLAGIRLALQLGRSRAARGAQLRVRDLPLAPSCGEHAPLSERYWRCALPLLAESLHGRPAGTARMGGPGDAAAVVDCRLRVRGVRRLRVADASVMPDIAGGPLEATTVAIGTTAADILAEDWE